MFMGHKLWVAQFIYYGNTIYLLWECNSRFCCKNWDKCTIYTRAIVLYSLYKSVISIFHVKIDITRSLQILSDKIEILQNDVSKNILFHAGQKAQGLTILFLLQQASNEKQEQTKKIIGKEATCIIGVYMHSSTSKINQWLEC